jgi:hypothetical protein
MARLDRTIHAFVRAKSRPRVQGLDGRVKPVYVGEGASVSGQDARVIDEICKVCKTGRAVRSFLQKMAWYFAQ